MGFKQLQKRYIKYDIPYKLINLALSGVINHLKYYLVNSLNVARVLNVRSSRICYMAVCVCVRVCVLHTLRLASISRTAHSVNFLFRLLFWLFFIATENALSVENEWIGKALTQ